MNKIGSLMLALGIFMTVGCAANTEDPAPSSDEVKPPAEGDGKGPNAPPLVQVHEVQPQQRRAPQPPICICLVNADGTPTDLCYCSPPIL